MGGNDGLQDFADVDQGEIALYGDQVQLLFNVLTACDLTRIIHRGRRV